MHVAATYDGTDIRLYINGVQEGSKPGIAIVANNTNLGIGAEPATTVINFFQGALDDVRIYNRALTLAEIQALTGLPTPTPTNTAVPPTDTPTLIPTATNTPNPTNTPTDTPIPPSVTPTPTRVPTC